MTEDQAAERAIAFVNSRRNLDPCTFSSIVYVDNSNFAQELPELATAFPDLAAQYRKERPHWLASFKFNSPDTAQHSPNCLTVRVDDRSGKTSVIPGL